LSVYHDIVFFWNTMRADLLCKHCPSKVWGLSVPSIDFGKVMKTAPSDFALPPLDLGLYPKIFARAFGARGYSSTFLRNHFRTFFFIFQNV